MLKSNFYQTVRLYKTQIRMKMWSQNIESSIGLWVAGSGKMPIYADEIKSKFSYFSNVHPVLIGPQRNINQGDNNAYF